MLSFIFVPVLISMMTIGGAKKVYIYDTTGQYANAIISYVRPEEPKEKLTAKDSDRQQQ